MVGLDVEKIIQSGGVIAVAMIIFAESGLLIGFFLPGDTLLFTAGFFAAQGKLPLEWLIVSVIFAAITGDSVGYSIGRRTGHRIFTKKDGLLFRQEYIERAEKFYSEHGGKTIILARFIPVIRTFAPIIAGVGKMTYKRFLAFNIIGGFIWGGGVILLGAWLGKRIPNIDTYLMPAVLLAMLFTFSPMIMHLIKKKNYVKASGKSSFLHSVDNTNLMNCCFSRYVLFSSPLKVLFLRPNSSFSLHKYLSENIMLEFDLVSR